MTATPKFIHLRVHTAYSILEGENIENPHVQKKVTNDDKALTVTSNNSLKSIFMY